MPDPFIEQPILISPQEVVGGHHDLDEDRQPTDRPPQQERRRSELITPVPKPGKRKNTAKWSRAIASAACEQHSR